MPKQRAQTAARPSSPGVSLFEQASPARCKLTGTRPASCRTGSAKPLSKEAPSLWASLFPSKPALHVTNLPGFSADLSMQAILFSDKSATIPEHGRPPTELALQNHFSKKRRLCWHLSSRANRLRTSQTFRDFLPGPLRKLFVSWANPRRIPEFSAKPSPRVFHGGNAVPASASLLRQIRDLPGRGRPPARLSPQNHFSKKRRLCWHLSSQTNRLRTSQTYRDFPPSLPHESFTEEMPSPQTLLGQIRDHTGTRPASCRRSAGMFALAIPSPPAAFFQTRTQAFSRADSARRSIRHCRRAASSTVFSGRRP